MIGKTWKLLALGCFAIFSQSCSVDSARNHYVLAEKLWNDRKYAASVSEFEKVIVKDPHGKLGAQAMYRAAMTQALFLSAYSEAIRNFRKFTQENVEPKLIWEAELQIGDILFSKTEQYDQAITHYQFMLQSGGATSDAPEILYRVGKSHFFLFQFGDAITAYTDVIHKYSGTLWAEKASFELGETYFTRGEQRGESSTSASEAYEMAISDYKKFMAKYPKSDLVPRARFGIASCYEELDRLDDAYEAYSTLQKIYPSPKVIEIKLARIRDRMSQKHSLK